MKTILTIVGARPQFIKAAALSRAFTKCDGIREAIVHTGQHGNPSMSDIFFSELGMPAPIINLAIAGGRHGAMTGHMLVALETVMIDNKPDAVLVYGDTNSTLAGALAAAKLDIPVAHVEAGLRSGNRRSPEEVNRVLVDHVSRWLFCPTKTSVANLKAEGITRGVFHSGDVMLDALNAAVARARATSVILDTLGLANGQYAVATIHRAETTDDTARLGAIFGYLIERARLHPIVMPLHPRTRKALAQSRIETGGIRMIEPLGYLDMVRLLEGAVEVLTDSGGLQKEAYFLRKPCVTLRGETEWIETIEAGWNRLWTVPGYRARHDISDYGRGHASEAICSTLLAELK